MTPRRLPPTSGRFVKGRSGNPLGQPPRNFRERDFVLLVAKFFETLAKAIVIKAVRWKKTVRLRISYHEKKVLFAQKL